MGSPRISVIMPAYNAQNFIRKSIESILNQTLTDLEFIIINDGSSDSTLEIIQEYQRNDSRIKILNQENRGIVKSLNRGIMHSKGDYIARMDADDICWPERLEKQLQYLKENPKIDLISCGYQPIDEHDKNIGEPILHPSNENALKIALCFSSPICHPGVMAKREVFSNFPYKEKVSEDHALWISIARKYLISNIEEPLIKYRITENSLSKRNKLRISLETKTRGLLFFLWLYRNNSQIMEEYVEISKYRTINVKFFKYYNGILARKKR